MQAQRHTKIFSFCLVTLSVASFTKECSEIANTKTELSTVGLGGGINPMQQVSI